MDTAAHVGNIFLNTVDNLTRGGLINKADRQPSQLIGNADAQITGIVSAYHIVHQIHLANIHSAFQEVYPRQHSANRQQRSGQSLGGALTRPRLVQKLNALSQQLGGHNGTCHHYTAQQGTQQQPAINGLCVPHQSAHNLPRAHFCILSRFLFTVHRRSPPV